MKKNGTTSVVPLPSFLLGSRSTQHCEAERNSAPFRASNLLRELEPMLICCWQLYTWRSWPTPQADIIIHILSGFVNTKYRSSNLSA